MDLTAYLNQPGNKAADLAKAIGVSDGRLSQIKGGQPCPPELALKIEAATNGVVSASALSHVIALARAA
jgi:DNA-binding transcriptional regulator YdaS (Cro superfamily)